MGDGLDVFVGNAGRVEIVVLEGSTDGTSVDVIEGFEEQAVKMIAIIKKITFVSYFSLLNFLCLTCDFCCALVCLTVCVTCWWAGADSAWEQYKLEAGKMLENADESHLSSARGVGQPTRLKAQ